MGTIVKHLAFIAGIAALIVLLIVYPFLPGGHDQLAVALSTMAQVFGFLDCLSFLLVCRARDAKTRILESRAVDGCRHQLLPRLKRARPHGRRPFQSRALVPGAPACDRAYRAAGPCRSRHLVEQSSCDRERERVDQ
jgi:hypothetical protein